MPLCDLEGANLEQWTGEVGHSLHLPFKNRNRGVSMLATDKKSVALFPRHSRQPCGELWIVLLQGVENGIANIEFVHFDPLYSRRRAWHFNVEGVQGGERVSHGHYSITHAEPPCIAMDPLILGDQVLGSISHDRGEQRLIHGVVGSWRWHTNQAGLFLRDTGRRSKRQVALEHGQPSSPHGNVGDPRKVEVGRRVSPHIVMMLGRHSKELEGRPGPNLQVHTQRLASNRDVAVDKKQHRHIIPERASAWGDVGTRHAGDPLPRCTGRRRTVLIAAFRRMLDKPSIALRAPFPQYSANHLSQRRESGQARARVLRRNAASADP